MGLLDLVPVALQSHMRPNCILQPSLDISMGSSLDQQGPFNKLVKKTSFHGDPLNLRPTFAFAPRTTGSEAMALLSRRFDHAVGVENIEYVHFMFHTIRQTAPMLNLSVSWYLYKLRNCLRFNFIKFLIIFTATDLRTKMIVL